MWRKMLWLILPAGLLVLAGALAMAQGVGTTTRVSVASDGTQGNGESIGRPAISADGRYIAFLSKASNLVSGDTNGKQDVFVHDRQTGQTTRVSVASDGTQGNYVSKAPSISADGRYVAFESAASNLVSGDTNFQYDVFVHDRLTGRTTLVSVSSDGTLGSRRAGSPSISADGRYVAFESASNLVSGDTNDDLDVFLHDRDTGLTTRVSVASDGVQGNGDSEEPSIADDGSVVAFTSDATNLVNGDTNGYSDVFVHDRGAGLPPKPSGQESGGPGANRDYEKTRTIGDPLSAGNGAYSFQVPLLALGGPMDLGFGLLYRSDFQRSGAFLPPAFWWQPFATGSLGVPRGSNLYATFYLPDGNLLSFKKQGDHWVPVDAVEEADVTYRDNASRVKYVLQETATFAYLMDPIAERVYLFQKYRQGDEGEWLAHIVQILDRNGNALKFTYPGSDMPSQITDGLGRSLTLAYLSVGGNAYLAQVTDQGKRKVDLNYEAQGADNDNAPTLRSITDPLGQTATLSYAGKVVVNHLIAGRQLPAGNTPFTQTYQSQRLNGVDFARVTAQQDAYGNTTTLGYAPDTNVVTETRPDGTAVTYEHFSQHSQPKAITDATGNSAGFTKNDDEQLTGVTDRLGATTTFTYHAETGKLASMTNARGHTLTYTYTAQTQTFINPISSGESVAFTFYNLTRANYPDGTSEQFAYDAQGNLLTHTDRAGQAWSYTYNSRGQALTATNPRGGVLSYTYNTDATLATCADSETGTIHYTYDTYKRPARITHPDGAFLQLAYDLNDRVTSSTDENSRATTFQYDANGNLVGLTDPLAQTTQHAYDLMDRLTQLTDRLGKSHHYDYDALGRLATLTDATGTATGFSYDPRGWLNRVTRDGRSWQTDHDAEGIPVARTTPLGNTTRMQSDALGYLASVTNALGYTTTLSRDALSRVTEITDPLSRVTSFDYDERGLLIGVTAPVIGTAAYQRDALGQLARITDLNGQSWAFAYTPMGRLQTQTDPLNHARQYSYDSRGRLSQTDYPDGVVLTHTYDAASNPIRRQYSDGTDLSYTYDALNRLIGTNGLQLTHDAEGRIINTGSPDANFGATYDDAGRLQTASYNNGAFTVTYTYSPATGLLTGVTDSLAGVQVDFSCNDDFRPVSLRRSNGVATTFTWDPAGRLTRIQEGSLIDLQYTLDAAGQVTQVNLTAPLDPASALSVQTDTFAYNAASEVSSAGYSYDVQGRLTASPGHTYRWDGASRLTGVDATQLSYNGLGEVVTRTKGSTTTHLYYNYALGLAPIVAERNATTGQFQRYYVWTPDGRLLYIIDASNGNVVYFYHFDRTGSTLALTDATGAVTDSYAYDPYGRLLAHQGTNPQPFTFVGKWGVRQEDASGALYHMRARYYDAVTGRFFKPRPCVADAN